MADFSIVEKQSIEKVLRMGDGYVLNFSDRTFGEFVLDAVGIDPYAHGMDANGGSKAKRLRHIFNTQPNYIAGKLLAALFELESTLEENSYRPVDEATRQRARAVADRLRQGAQIEDAAALTPNTNEQDFEVLAKELRAAIDSDRPEVALDRLHTFAVKFIRAIYSRHFKRTPDQKTTANSLLGEYANDLRDRNVLDSKMASEILKSSARILDEFNHVRNNQTLAHDNDALLSRSEARFIFASVSASIRFLGDLEEKQLRSKP
ncbi:abortive infection family protein [Edaphobacter aggregans]|uniref:abortive infection family protein n=1 Tax=Edaphobacter aggregans TaxID=570835 RepID=UPI00054D110F|nr:abortive infection family protein [Edaphobacter aggregans]